MLNSFLVRNLLSALISLRCIKVGLEPSRVFLVILFVYYDYLRGEQTHDGRGECFVYQGLL